MVRRAARVELDEREEACCDAPAASTSGRTPRSGWCSSRWPRPGRGPRREGPLRRRPGRSGSWWPSSAPRGPIPPAHARSRRGSRRRSTCRSTAAGEALEPPAGEPQAPLGEPQATLDEPQAPLGEALATSALARFALRSEGRPGGAARLGQRRPPRVGGPQRLDRRGPPGGGGGLVVPALAIRRPRRRSGVIAATVAVAALLTLAGYAFLGVARFSPGTAPRERPLLAVGRDRLVVLPWVGRDGAVDTRPEGRLGAAIPLAEVRGAAPKPRGQGVAVELDTEHGAHRRHGLPGRGHRRGVVRGARARPRRGAPPASGRHGALPSPAAGGGLTPYGEQLLGYQGSWPAISSHADLQVPSVPHA